MTERGDGILHSEADPVVAIISEGRTEGRDNYRDNSDIRQQRFRSQSRSLARRPRVASRSQAEIKTDASVVQRRTFFKQGATQRRKTK